MAEATASNLPEGCYATNTAQDSASCTATCGSALSGNENEGSFNPRFADIAVIGKSCTLIDAARPACLADGRLRPEVKKAQRTEDGNCLVQSAQEITGVLCCDCTSASQNATGCADCTK